MTSNVESHNQSGGVTAGVVVGGVARGMTDEEYGRFVDAGCALESFRDTHRERLMLAGMGIAGEAGEVCDLAKKTAFHGKVMELDKMVEELGDTLWYFTLMTRLYGLTLDQIREANVRKLCKRYPDMYGPADIWV